MRSRRRRRDLGLAVLAAALALIAPQRVTAAPAAVRLDWAVLLRAPGGSMRTVDCSRDPVQLRSGDRIRVWLRPSDGCYAYLYLHDAQHHVYVLFPGSFDAAGGWPAARSFLVPGQDSWFRLDDQPGTEILYLLLSDHRLRELEKETGTAGGPGRAARTVEHPAGVLEEIRRLVVKGSGLVRAVDRPVPVAGDFRGLDEEPEIGGVSTEAVGLHVRTIRLVH